jgi:molybdopterin-guanine dinucleotide biosynthesis protein B
MQSKSQNKAGTLAPPVISIVSKKNCGKTTLIEKLIPELASRDIRVGTIKHDTHGFDIDHEGKDTWRHKQAGALTVAISCPWKLSLIRDVEQEVDLDDIAEAYFADMDLVLTEGYKRAPKPKIEVYRSAAHQHPLHAKGASNTLIAVVSDVPLDLGVPNFDINDVVGLADFIVQRFLSSSET